MEVVAPRSGHVTEMVAGAVGVASMVLGGGRERAEDGIDHAVGVICRAKPGEEVRAGQTIYEVHYRSTTRMLDALPLLEESFTVGDSAPEDSPIVLEEVA
jgi:thymidine phosphorylase